MKLFHCCKKTIALSLLVAIFAANSAFAQTSTQNSDNNTLLESFIKSKNYSSIIDFNSSNIKQFWIDKSVFSKDNNFWITLQQENGKWNSIPYGIQLANVNESLDCTIEVISNTPNVGFVVTNRQSKQLSSSKKEDDFLDYHISSATIHLEDTKDFFFNISFNSNTSDELSVKKIILSFSTNKESSYLATPGSIQLTKEDIKKGEATSMPDGSFIVKGKTIHLFGQKKILVTNNILKNNIKIKNVGEKPVKINVGYSGSFKDGKPVKVTNYPYKPNSKTLNVISSEKGSSVIVVDSYPEEWRQKCALATNAKDDFSDVPNMSLLPGTIVKIEKLDNGYGEITMDKPLEQPLEKGTKIRVHGATSGYFYTGNIILNPNEETVLTSTIQKDDSLIEYVAKAFPKGTYYVTPLVIANSTDPDTECAIQIVDYSVSY